MTRSSLATAFLVIGLAFATFGLLIVDGDRAPRARVLSSSPDAPTSLPPAGAAPADSSRNDVQRWIVRLEVPRIGVDAPVTALGLDPSGAMPSPAGPAEVAWYDFSGKPGRAGNIVMAGHVDYVNYGPAVFWRLSELEAGDEIRLSLDDGETLVYRVQEIGYYEAAAAPVAEIVGPTATESVTLITCGGNFDRGTSEYDQRLVVRAVRTHDSVAFSESP